MESNRKLKILLLEDSDDDALLIERTLFKDGLPHLLRCAETKQEFMDAIREFRPDVVLSDHGLPQFNSMEALGISLKEIPKAPFILVTGSVSDEFAVSCLRAGADDYILKSNLTRLPSAIRNAVRKKTLDRLKREARTALRAQNNELLKANKELDTFVYSVSHNLRGPLASLMGLLAIARETDAEQKFGDIHDMMGTTMLKLDETLKEIVDYSRNARGELQLGVVDWHTLTEGVFHRLEYLFKKKEIVRLVELKCDVPVISDSDRIAVVLTNLVANAAIFSSSHRKPCVSIEIQTHPDHTQITVTDNGIGIRSEVLPKIWNMFYRGNEASQGAGLGLYVVRETIGRLHGTVSLTSEVDQGTTIRIELPNLAG
ncbi:MAG TPA: hybrid sensor histidine kinase/response regulator [Chryseolinea sp.]|nr:hybrid sensor histidine kinase/response regulator [Chryseolinea sp.]